MNNSYCSHWLVGLVVTVVVIHLAGCATQPSSSSRDNAPFETALKKVTPNAQQTPSPLTILPYLSTETGEVALASPEATPGPPSGAIPSYAPTDPTSTMDLACRPKLTTTALKSVYVDPDNLAISYTYKAVVLTPGGTIFDPKKTHDYDFVPLLLAKIPLVNLTNVQNISGPFGHTEDAVGPVATIRYAADGQLMVGPVGMVPTRIVPKLREKGIYLAVGPVGTVMVQKDNTAWVVGQDGNLQRLLLRGETDFPKKNPHVATQPIASAIVGQSVLGLLGQPVYLNAPVTGYMDANCRALSPWTRLLLENAGVSANYNYSNQSGLISSPGSNPTSIIQTTATSSYGVGVGYTNKPILKQFRSLFFPSNSRYATFQQGTPMEDLVWNAITINASYSYGRTLAIKNSVPTNTFNTRPYYSVGATWAVDLERLWVYGKRVEENDRYDRPLDSGFYYRPPPDVSSAFFTPSHQEPDWPASPLGDDNRP